MEQVPRVRLGMPVYNAAAYLESTLDAIAAQTIYDHEVIVSDNAPTDNTREICERYAHSDTRIRYSRNEQNVGASWNFNHVYALGRAPYFKQVAHDEVAR